MRGSLLRLYSLAGHNILQLSTAMSALNEKKTDSVDHMEHANLKEELAAYRHNAGEDFLKAKITPKLWFLLGFCMLNAGAYGLVQMFGFL